MYLGEKLADFFSYFNPFEKSFHSLDSFSHLGGFDKAQTIFFTVVGAIFGLGIGGLAAFRFCAKNLSPQDQKTSAVAKSILQQQMVEAIKAGQWERLDALWKKSIENKIDIDLADLALGTREMRVSPDATTPVDIFKETVPSIGHEGFLFRKAIIDGDPKLFQVAITSAEIKGLMPRELLLQVAPTLTHNKLATDFLKRIMASYDHVVTFAPDKTQLSAFQMLHISCIGENALRRGGTENIRVKKRDVGIAHSLLIDYKQKNFTIIQGVHGVVKAQGAYGKVRSTIEVSLQKVGEIYQAKETEIVDTVRKTLHPNPEIPHRKFQPNEVKYEAKYGDLRTHVLYVQKGIEKETMTFKAYPHTLESYMKTSPFSNAALFAVMDQVTSTLQRMHHDNVVHRDIKIANILFNPPNKAKLADFGEAKEISAEQPLERNITPLYVSPEIVLGRAMPQDLEHKKAQDMFALGLTLYCCIIGKENVPWKEALSKWWYENNGNPVISSPMEGIILTTLHSLNPSHPFTALCKGLLHPNPARRLTIDQCRKELQRIQTLLQKSPS